MPEIEAVAELCEKATGPDRELDAEIAALLCGGKVDVAGRFWKPGVRGFCIAPRYTVSLDAAMTLSGDDPYQVLIEAMVRCPFASTDGNAFLKALPRFVVCAALRAHLARKVNEQ